MLNHLQHKTKAFYFMLCMALLVFMLESCKQNKTKSEGSEPEITSTENFDWLIGNWIRTNEKQGQSTYENWLKQSDILYFGFGYTLQNNDTVFKESLKLIRKDNEWIYGVSGVHEKPVPFRMVSRTTSSFTCKNENNSFPKNIKYSLEDKILTAEISADGRKVRFLFTRNSSDSK